MTAATRRAKYLVAALLSLAGAAPAQDYGFMPKGGRTLLLETLGPSPDQAELRAIVSARRSEAEWRDFVAARAKALGEREAATLAAYLAVNTPLPAGAALPQDGRELAWNQCQFCHSLFTSHLTQDKGLQAWRNMFESPFHRELKMSPQEREEFSRYSAINMPMKFEDVPPELRF